MKSKRIMCPICKSTEIIRLFGSRDRMFALPGAFTVKRCNSCGQVFLHPQLTKKQVAPYYPAAAYYAYKKETKKGFFARLREYLVLHYYRPTVLSRLIALVVADVPAIPREVPGGKVLDIGCGTGDTLVLLKKIGWDVYGMDIDLKALAIAKKRGVTHVKQGFMEDIRKYPDNYFDAIRLYHVIEHIDTPALAMKLLLRKVKRGGEVVIGTPNYNSLVSKLFGTYWYNLDSPRHLFLFTPGTLRRLATNAGFVGTIVEFCSAGGFVGSIQYLFNDRLGWKIDLIHSLGWVLLFYPLEWVLDKLHMGDVFVMRVRKQ